MKALALNCATTYLGYLLSVTMLLWVILCFGIFNGPICGTMTRWDYLFPARIAACSMPRLDAIDLAKQGFNFMSQNLER